MQKIKKLRRSNEVPFNIGKSLKEETTCLRV